MSKLRMSQLLGYKDFYFEITRQTTKHKFAKQIGKDFLLKFISHFLAQFRNHKLPPAEDLMKEFFTFGQHKFEDDKNYDKLVSRYNYLKEKYQTDYKLISIESLLYMFTWLTNNPNLPTGIQQGPEQILPMFKLFLLFNDDVLEKYKKSYKRAESVPPDRRIRRMILGMSFPQNDLLNADYAQILRTQFYKGAKLLDFMEANQKYHKLLQKLLDDFGCTDKEDFFKSMGAAIVFGIQSLNGGWTILDVPQNNDFNKACFFLDKLAIEEEAIPELQDDFLEVRNKPLRKIGNGQYLVVYDLFLIKKIYNGLIFYLSALTRKDKNLIKGPLFGHLRMDFSEATLVYDTMNYIYHDASTIKISGNEFKAAGINETEPDFYVRKNTDILLIESKDFYVPGEIKMSYDFDQIESALKDGRLWKAVEQIETNIKRTIKKELIVDTAYDVAQIHIFPIIIVHDALYSAAGLNYWINYWFDDSISKIKKDKEFITFNFERLFPVTLVEIDTLLFFEENFHEGDMDLVNLLREFHQEMSYRKQTFLTAEELVNHAYTSAIPFAEFVRTKARDNNISLKEGPINQVLVKVGLT